MLIKFFAFCIDKVYFEKVWKMIFENVWEPCIDQECFMQSLVLLRKTSVIK